MVDHNDRTDFITKFALAPTRWITLSNPQQMGHAVSFDYEIDWATD